MRFGMGDRPKPRPHTHEEIVNTFLEHALMRLPVCLGSCGYPGAVR